jgi:hypothetical protein
MYVHILYISRVDFYLDDIQLMILFLRQNQGVILLLFYMMFVRAMHELGTSRLLFVGQNQASFYCFSI